MAVDGHHGTNGVQLKQINVLHDALVNDYTQNNVQSLKHNNTAKSVMPTGTTRAVLSYDPFPLAFQSGHDTYVTSLDGHEYLDLVSEYCAGMYGHNHPAIEKAVLEVLNSGHSLGGCNVDELQLAEKLVSRFPSVEQIRFCNSGNEANTFAIATALVFTKRQKVMVFREGYHGGSLMFPAKGGRLNIPHQFVYGAFNDVEATRAEIQEDIGVILVEPMQGAGGSVLGTRAFLSFLRHEATRIGAVLIFDEVITSRLVYGGLQEYFGIIPDMTTIGKHFGGGFAFGAFGGRRDIMQQYDSDRESPLFHSGTWNNNRFTMAAGSVGTSLLTRAALTRTGRLGDMLRDGIQKIFAGKNSCPGVVRGFSSVVGVGFHGPNAEKIRDALFFYLVKRRIYIGRRGFMALNILHQEVHVKQTLQAIQDFCDEVFD